MRRDPVFNRLQWRQRCQHGVAMLFRILADAVMSAHFAFIVFVIFGGLLALKWPKAVWVHLPCFLWGVTIITAGWVCPLTPLEQHLRRAAGQAGYEDSFIEHYLLPVIYPGELTQGLQLVLGGALLLFNVLVYGWIWTRRRRGRS